MFQRLIAALFIGCLILIKWRQNISKFYTNFFRIK